MKTKQAPGKYNRVGAQKGPLNLGGALAKMEEDSSMVYVPKFHVAGTKKEITSWLKENKPEEKVSDVLASSYSKDTLKDEDLREAFDQEVLLAQRDRDQARDHRDQLRVMNLDFLSSFVQTYEEEQRSLPKSERSGNVHSKAAASLKQKVKSLKDEEKILDVSMMKKNGKDAKKFAADKLGNKKRLAQSDGVHFYHVVYNQSNKSAPDGVRNFLRLHGGFDTDKISAIVDQVKSGADINIGIAKSPTRSTLASPTRRNRGRSRRAADEDLLE